MSSEGRDAAGIRQNRLPVHLAVAGAVLGLMIAGLACGAKPGAKPVADRAAAPAKPPVVFERYVDRTEGAFIVLVPKGWTTQGGIVRVSPLGAAGGIGQSLEAKIDFAILREPSGLAMIRYLPKVNYAEPSPYNAMLGGNWNGMPVVARPAARDYLLRILFPQLRPRASGMTVIEYTQRPDVEAAVRSLPAARALLSQGAQYSVDAGVMTVRYNEADTVFKEVLFVAVEGFNLMGTALWSNPFTIVARAPEAEFDAGGPIARTVINSFALNPRWMAAEMRGQAQRAKIVQETLAEIARIDREITENRSRVMAQINEQQYLTLTSQEKYVNPFSGEPELGSNEYKHRWEDASGQVIYTDDGNWDPNVDPNLNLSGFKRSAVHRAR